MIRCISALLLLNLLLRAQPAIGQNGVVNSASRIPSGLASGAIARGALFTIRGVRLGSQGHTRVRVRSREHYAEVNVLTVSAGQIDARMPNTAPLGAASLIVTVDGQDSAPAPVEIVGSNPGLFSRNRQGWGPAKIENIASGGSHNENSLSNPARPGERVAVFGTGFGATSTATIIVGGRTVKASHLVSRQGQERVEFVLPSSIQEGCYVPVAVLVELQRVSNVVTMSIRSGSGPCNSSMLPTLDSGSIAFGVLARSRMLTRSGSDETVTDEGMLIMAKGDEPFLSPLLLLPPPGVCTEYTSSFQAETVLPNSITATLLSLLRGHGLDAGPQVNLIRGSESRILRRDNNVIGYYHGRLGQAGAGAGQRARALFLDPDEFIVQGTGGKDVGPYEVHVSSASEFQWVNRSDLATVDRNRPLKLEWRDLSPDHPIVIVATNVDQITTATGVCLCVSRSRAGEFTIPAAMLANIPASSDLSGISYDRIFLSSFGKITPLRPSGVDAGVVAGLFSVGRFVRFR